MKQSDSATSLTNLVVCDTACYFCNEGGDVEAGVPLIDMKKFLNCDCRLTSHSKCWLKHLSNITESPVSCPLCKMSIAGWKKKEASDASYASEAIREKKGSCISCPTNQCWAKILCWSLGFIIVITLVLLSLRISGQI